MAVLGEGRYGTMAWGELEAFEFTAYAPYQVELHRRTGELMAIFENVAKVGYEFVINQQASMSFGIPVSDPKRELIGEGDEVWLYEDNVLVECFRITGRALTFSTTIPVERTYGYVLVSESSPAKLARFNVRNLEYVSSLVFNSGEEYGWQFVS